MALFKIMIALFMIGMVVGYPPMLVIALLSRRFRLHIRKHPAVYLVWTLCFFIVMFVPQGSPTFLNGARRAETENRENRVLIGVESYRKEYDVQPEPSDNASLIAILAGNNPRRIDFVSFRPRDFNSQKELLDGWQQPFRVSSNNGKVTISSAGADRQWGTKDDITASQPEQPARNSSVQ